MYKELFLAAAVSIDTYLAAAAYCNSGIKIPLLSCAVINTICAAVLGISIYFSDMLSRFISAEICERCGFFIMTAIGIMTIAKSIVRSLVKHISENGVMSVKIGKSALAVKLYLDDTAADIDNSKILSAGEASALALASSLDSAATGISSGLSDISPLSASLLTFLCGFAAVLLGSATGKKISSLSRDLSWLGGVLLIILAFLI